MPVLITSEIAVPFVLWKRSLAGKIFWSRVRNEEEVRLLLIKMLVPTSGEGEVMIVELAKNFCSETLFKRVECNIFYVSFLLHFLRPPSKEGGV